MRGSNLIPAAIGLDGWDWIGLFIILWITGCFTILLMVLMGDD